MDSHGYKNRLSKADGYILWTIGTLSAMMTFVLIGSTIAGAHGGFIGGTCAIAMMIGIAIVTARGTQAFLPQQQPARLERMLFALGIISFAWVVGKTFSGFGYWGGVAGAYIVWCCINIISACRNIRS